MHENGYGFLSCPVVAERLGRALAEAAFIDSPDDARARERQERSRKRRERVARVLRALAARIDAVNTGSVGERRPIAAEHGA